MPLREPSRRIFRYVSLPRPARGGRRFPDDSQLDVRYGPFSDEDFLQVHDLPPTLGKSGGKRWPDSWYPARWRFCLHELRIKSGSEVTSSPTLHASRILPRRGMDRPQGDGTVEVSSKAVRRWGGREERSVSRDSSGWRRDWSSCRRPTRMVLKVRRRMERSRRTDMFLT